MNYRVLARKWRPTNFNEVIGQEHVLRALTNALTQQRLHHAYLLTGTRGVGKTTIARILAKCINCETGITANPCGKCDACTEIDAGRFIDLIEVDAASKTKVEDTRDLLDNVQYLPAKGRYKVYLIDEVHMLSGHSFNALLKTLEEPPEHVKFLLATTDPQKLPVTVLSRCLQFNLKALPPETIQKQLTTILEKEQISFEAPALHQLALAANGSVRDALSLLDQGIAFCQGKITLADIDNMLGTIEKTKIFKLINALINNDATAMLTIIAELAELANDFAMVLEELITVFHQIAVLQLVPNVDTSNWASPETISALASQLTPEEVQLDYQIGLIGKRDLQLAPTSRLGFEMLMLRMLAFRPEQVTTAPITNIKQPTNKVAAVEKPTTKPLAVDTAKLDLLKQIKVTGPTQALLNHCAISKIDDCRIELLLEPTQAPMLNKKHEERLSQAFTEYLQKPITVTISIGSPNIITPAKLTQQVIAQKQHQATQSLEQDAALKEIMSKFGATIIPNSIESQDK